MDFIDKEFQGGKGTIANSPEESYMTQAEIAASRAAVEKQKADAAARTAYQPAKKKTSWSSAEEAYSDIKAFQLNKEPSYIAEVQKYLGIPSDGIWGTVTQRAFEKAKRNAYLKTKEGKAVDAKIKTMQARLNVKADGIWGNKSQKALEKVKATQRSLGVVDDGIVGRKTRAALEARFKEASEAMKLITAPTTTSYTAPTSGISIKAVVPSKTDRELRQEARDIRRTERKEARMARKSPEVKREGGIFY